MALLRRTRKALSMLVLRLVLLRGRRRRLRDVLLLVLLPVRGLQGVVRLVRRAYRVVDVLLVLLSARLCPSYRTSPLAALRMSLPLAE
jgi:hypothetical protein